MLFHNLNEVGKIFIEYQKTVITIVSGMFGGLGRLLMFPVLDISIFKSIEVCVFAALSAIIGYIVKSLLDLLGFYLRKRFTKTDKDSDKK